MRVLVAGGLGFLGSAVAKGLTASGHEVWVLTRQAPQEKNEIQWDGQTAGGWAARLNEMDAVVNVTGYGLEHWPWTTAQKRRFVSSRVGPGAALTAGIREAKRRPHVFVQISGINFYGATGDGVADESWPASNDFLAQLAVQWEAATAPLEGLGVRRAIGRSAVVLDAHGGLFPLMALPVKMGVGGPLGSGRQAVPWIQLEDQVRALQFLLENEQARGPFNLIAPQLTSNAEFMRAIARHVHRPYWFPTPGFLLRAALGEMSTLVLEGRYARPMKLEELGFAFLYPTIDAALEKLFPHRSSYGAGPRDADPRQNVVC